MRALSLLPAVVSAMLFGAPLALADQAIPLDRLDAKVIQAINGKFQGAELLSAEREIEAGKTTYEVKIRHEGAMWEVDVSEDGQITEAEREDEDGAK
jgi:uncharacterized membrane protein YkoI